MTNKIQLKTPEDVRRYVCKVLRTIQESGDEQVIANAGKISQLLGQWIKAYEVQELNLPFGRRVRVVQLTDIHSGIYMSRKEMRRYAEQVNALQPDMFVLTGDYISNSMLFLPPCLEEMARVSARCGRFATLGNHEHWYGQLEELQAIFNRHGIPLLQNSHQVIETPEGPFAVAGIDDLRTGAPDLPAALRGIAPGIPTILLSHRPEIFPHAAAGGTGHSSAWCLIIFASTRKMTSSAMFVA